MAHSFHHAQSSAKRFGGIPDDYIHIHSFMDSSKSTYADFRHRAILHSTFGIFITEQVFGTTITNSDGKKIPVRIIAEQHVKEDHGGKIPTVEEWLHSIKPEQWMNPSPAQTRALNEFIAE
jgi:hypothetical protein